MSHSACSIPLIAELITAPPGNRVNWYITAQVGLNVGDLERRLPGIARFRLRL